MNINNEYAQNKKYMILAFVVLMQACLGGMYSWSIFDSVFIKEYNINPTLSSAPFNLFYLTFPLTLLVANKIVKKFGTKFCAILGGVLFGSGWIIAGFGQFNFYVTLLGIGLFSGVGVGLAYLVSLSVGVAWFPDKRGMVTGLAVGGYAGGAALVSQIAQALMNHGLTPFGVLHVVGLAYVALNIIAGSFMQNPASYKKDSTSHIDIKHLIKNPLFIALFISMTTGLTAGFFVNSKLALISRDYNITLVLSAVAIFAIFNAIGRVVWGIVSDYIQPKLVINLNLLTQVVTLLSASMLLKSNVGAMMLAALSGFNYGGVLVLYASTVGYFWGNDSMKSIYAWLFLCNILAAGLNSALGYLYSEVGLGYPIIIAMSLLVVAFCANTFFIKGNKCNELETTYE